MNDELAVKEARIMYRRHGREAQEGVVTELADAMLRSGCFSCALEAVRAAGDDGPKPLTVPMLRGAVHERMSTGTYHLAHVSADTREDEASKSETFWRSTGADVIARCLELDPTSAKFLAAKIWASGAVPAHPSQLEDEFDPVYGATEVWSALFGPVGGVPVSLDVMEAAFAQARVEVLEGAA